MLALIVFTLCVFLNAQQFVYAVLAGQMREPPVQQRAANNTVVRSADKTEVEFEGNQAFSASELTGMMKQCQTKYTTAQETPDPARVFDECLRRIRFFYTERGYLRAAFGEQQKYKTERGVKIVVPVEEGVRYRIGEIKVEGAKLFSPDQIIEMLHVKTGDVADGAAIGVGLFERLRKAYANKGYIQYEAEPTPDFKPVPAGETEGVVDFNISITEGKVFVVRSIKFDGNKLNAAEELRRVLLLHKGDTYSQQLFEDSIKKLNESGLFDKVIDADRDVDFRQYKVVNSQAVDINNGDDSGGGENRFLDIIVHVKEKAR